MDGRKDGRMEECMHGRKDGTKEEEQEEEEEEEEKLRPHKGGAVQLRDTNC